MACDASEKIDVDWAGGTFACFDEFQVGFGNHEVKAMFDGLALDNFKAEKDPSTGSYNISFGR